ncbi:hypothetical protein SUGI_0845150 [Cryptomeria japonica]|nr:hypothetical protein SUGI_0845150 [Cryptomeria japonica]
MGALKTALLTIAGLALAWFTMEIAFKPHLGKGRSAMGKALDPNYDPDDDKVDRSPEYERDSGSSSDEEEEGTPPKKK